MKPRFAVAVLSLVSLAVTVLAQSMPVTYDSSTPSVNAGDHSWVTFGFPRLEEGATELIVQCGFHRAEVVLHAGVYGEQMSSQFFAVTCPTPVITYANSVPSTTWTVNGTPLSESLVFNKYDGTTETLNMTINKATWTFTGYCAPRNCTGRASGEAEVTY